MTHSRSRAAVVAAVALVLMAGAALAARLTTTDSPEASPLAKLALAGKEPQASAQGGTARDESREAFKAQEQFDSARIAPGNVVKAGAYSEAFGSLTGLPKAGDTWSELTKLPYDADDPDYRDYDSTRAAARASSPAASPASRPTTAATSMPQAPWAVSGGRRRAAGTGSRSPTRFRACRRATSS